MCPLHDTAPVRTSARRAWSRHDQAGPLGAAYASRVPADRAALGAFLRSRRDRLTPAQAGIEPFPGPRRVPGLRKEELAVLVGLSADHYSRLEQGRQGTVGHDVLESLSRALRLDEVERAHLHDLAGPARRTRHTGWEAPQRADPGLLRLMTTLDHVPTLLLGRRGEVLARNRLLPAVLGADLAPGSSFVRWLFLDPEARRRIVTWADYAAAAVGALRYELGRHPDDRRLAELVQEVRASDPDVARWWDDHGVTDRTSVRKEIAHPALGVLSFGIEAVSTPHDLEQRLVVYTVEPGSVTQQALPLLASWTDVEPATTRTEGQR
jgi:transcriptional regulator with XRE-family HTH domain